MSDKFCLKWEKFHLIIAEYLKEKNSNKDFSDVTLAVDEDTVIKAHRFVLSAFSPVLEKILRKINHPEPFIYMTGMNSIALSAVIEFMYLGEVYIAEDDVAGFLKTASDLKIKGINNPLENQKEYSNLETNSVKYYEPENKISGYSDSVICDKGSLNEDEDFIEELSDVGTEQEFNLIPMDKGNTSDRSLIETDSQVENLMTRTPEGFKCIVCAKILKQKRDMQSHVESHVGGISYFCQHCDKSFVTRGSLRIHTIRKHR